ncbi:hypothetical protein COUCH_30140 [Couchioplanes caeruleus]|uniref:hypothetical protein n=1 Tax=Couchioplanes caeruleus TaxID=56438 RepID=UPI0020BE7476|nr:hypothetical protein [Couchioplanes caeruleus]UQU63243.1 hypothetical protein COUCH_30140 [Couchioplanes caeruleus]
MTGSTGSARQEAEKLVASLLAMAQGSDSAGLGEVFKLLTGTGSRQHKSSTGWATGTAECCVCPICRAIAAVRDPDPHTAERLAAGAGELATGVAGIMRAFATISSVTNPKPQSKPATRPEPTPDQAWAAATDHTPVAEPPIDENADPWGAATRSPAQPGHEAAARPAERASREAAPTARRDTGPAAGDQEPRTEESMAPKSVTRLSDPWAAAVANYAKAESHGETGVAGSGSVDHDVAADGTPAPAEDRGSRAGDDAPGDDAV